MKICVVAYKSGTVEEIGKHLGVYSYFISELKVLSQKLDGLQVVAPWLTLFKRGSTGIDGIKIIRTYPKTINSWKWFLIRRLFKQLYIYTTCRKLIALHKKEKFDLIYVWQSRESCVAALNFKKKFNVPIVFHQIGPWHWHLQNLNKPGLKNFIKRMIADSKNTEKYISRIYKETDKIIFPSRALEEELNSLNYGLDADVVPLAVDHNIFRPGINVDELRSKLELDGKKVLIFIGRIVFYEKGLNYLLEAVKILKDQGQKDFQLLIIGGGEATEINRLKGQISDLEIGALVSYLGKAPNDDLPAYLNLADVSLVPSIWFEILGRVIIEALSCGTPVICSDIGGMKEVNLNNKTGLVVPIKNSQSLAEAIKRILTDNELRQSFSQAGRQRVEDLYTYEVVADQLIAAFEKTINDAKK